MMMRPALRNEVLSIFGQLANPEEGYLLTRHFGMPNITLEALELLENVGAVSMDSGYAKITPLGYDYYRELRAPRRYWFTENVAPQIIRWGGSVSVAVTAGLIVLFLYAWLS